MTKEEFNTHTVASQIMLMNDLIEQFGSLREACKQIGINKSTVQSRFKKAGYVFEFNQYVVDEKFKSLVVEHKEVVEEIPNSLENVLPNVPELLDIDDDSFKNMGYLEKSNYLSSYKKTVQNCVNSIANSFVEIGKVLYLINKYELYSVANTSSIFEYASITFGIKKSTVYNLMAVYNRFGSTGVLEESYKNFSYSQLSEMVSLPKEIIDEIKETDSVREIKAKKKSLKEKNEDVVVDPVQGDEISCQVSVDDFEDYDITLVLKHSEIIDLLTVFDINNYSLDIDLTTDVLNKLRKSIGE